MLVLGWAVVSDRLARWNITGPLVFSVFGFVLANLDWGPLTVDVEAPTVHLLAEVTLALLLFADAARVNLTSLRHDAGLPARLLGIGLPLTVLLGSLAAAWLFQDFTWALAGFVGAALAPTDAALSAQVINDERIPTRVRRTLNVESGLNDGIVTPIVVFTLAVAADELGVHETSSAALHPLLELAIGVGVGVAIGFASAKLIALGSRRSWILPGGRRLATLAAAVGSFAAAGALSGNGFIAAFVAGIAFGAAWPRDDRSSGRGRRVPGTGRRGALARGVVPVRRSARSRRIRVLLGMDSRVRGAEPDRDPHASRRARNARHRTGPVDRPVHRMVRSEGSRLGRVRTPCDRGARCVGCGRPGRLRRRVHRAAERHRPRRHRRSGRPSFRDGHREVAPPDDDAGPRSRRQGHR